MNKDMICAVDGCLLPVKARGFCENHYYRFRRHGDPLGGRTEKGKPLRFLYETALPYAGDDCLTWPYGRNRHGYGQVQVYGRLQPAHRVICRLVHGNPMDDLHVAAHSCGNGHLACVNPRHLRWATPAENSRDRYIHGTARLGETNPLAKLTDEDIRAIRRMKGCQSSVKVGRQFGVDHTSICKIWNGKSWRHVT